MLPPELMDGEQLSKPFDMSQVSAGGGTVSVNSHDPQTTEKGKETASSHSPAPVKKPPPASKSG